MARYKLQPLGAPKYTTTLLGSDPSDSENYSIQSIIDFITANVDGINQNNTIRFFTTITASGKGIANAVVAFNATSYLSVSDEENIIVSVRRSDVNRSSTKTVQALLYDFYWLKTGKGTYGVNGTNVITTANLFYHGTTEEIYIETINNLPPVIYELSYEEIDVNDVSTFVNNAASFLIDSNADYFFLVREFEIGPGGFPSGTGNVQYYRFIGANGTYGLGLDQTTLADFVELSTNENQTTETTLLSLPEVWDNEITEDMLGHALTVVSNSNEPPGQGARFRPVLTSKDVFRANAVVWYGVTYIPNNTGLQYFVFCNKAIVNQKDYINFASNIITHPDGHGTYDRIDYVVYRMASDFNSATIVLIEGIPLLNPVEPNLDLTREAIIYQKRVLTTQTIDIDVTTDIVYNENSEWTNITQFTGSDLVSEADPFNGTYNFEVPSIGITSQLSLWERGSLTNFVTDNSFKFSIINRDLVSPLRNTLFEFKFINSTTGEYFIKSADSFSLRNYGYLRTSANWQIISVPFSNFTSNSRNNTQYDSFSISIGNSNALGLDWIHVGGGIEVVPPAGIFVKKIIPTYGLSVDETNSEQPIISLDGTPFKSVTTGLPSVNYDEDSYTTGKKGFNEPNPEEDIDLVGSVKYDYTYSNGVIARTAFGGLNINSENGYPASGIKGILLIVYPAPGVDEDTAAMSSQFLQADASGIGSVNLITILGTQTNDALRYASFRSAKSESNDLTYFAGLDTLSPTAITGKATRSWLRNYEKGLGSGFDKEPYFLFKLDNITDGIVQDSYMTPHLFSIGANMFQLRGFGVGNRLTGYTGTDTLDRTGTAATTIGAATYNLQVTADGYIIERALYPDDVITKTTSATSAGANFTITNLMRTVIAADTWVQVFLI
jgi:hypothetical protein